MKLLVVSHACATPINQQVFAELQRQTGWEVTLVLPSNWVDGYDRKLQPARWRDFNVELVAVPVFCSGSVPLHGYRMRWRRFLRHQRFDAIYVHNEPYSVSTAQVCHANIHTHRVPFGFYSCQNIVKKYPFPFSLTERMVYRSSSYAIPITQNVADVLKAKKFAGRVAVCPLPLDSDIYKPRDVASHNPLPPQTQSDQVTIGYVGRIVESKGLATLAHALGRIKNLPWRLIMIGAGPFEDQFKSLCHDQQLEDRIEHIGFIPHEKVPAYLASLDLLVIPSETQSNWKEQFGRVIVEALACGTPVIGSDSGEIPILINASGGGLVFHERNDEEFAQRLAQMICSPPVRVQYAESGRRYVLENMAHSTVANLLANTIRKADNTTT